MNSAYIQLSGSSVKAVQNICAVVRANNPYNSTTLKTAAGISDYVQKHGRLSAKQSEWICRSADYHNISRPEELSDIVVGRGKVTHVDECEGITKLRVELLEKLGKLEERVMNMSRRS
jgi:hypothetical protein